MTAVVDLPEPNLRPLSGATAVGWHTGSETPVPPPQSVLEHLLVVWPQETQLAAADRLNTRLALATRGFFSRDTSKSTDLIANGVNTGLMGPTAVLPILKPLAPTPLEQTAFRTARVGEVVVNHEHAGRGVTALKAAQDLKAWTALSWEELAAVASLNVGTIHYWQRTPSASPRSSTTLRLYELHSLTRAVRKRLTDPQAYGAWLHGADDSGVTPLEALRAGNREAFRLAAQAAAFGDQGTGTGRSSTTWRFNESDDAFEIEPPEASASSIRAAPRRPRARAQ